MYVRFEKIKTFYRIPLLFNEIFIHITNNGWYVHTTDRTVYNNLQWFKGSLMWKQELQNRWSQWSSCAKKSFFFFFRFVLYSYLQENLEKCCDNHISDVQYLFQREITGVFFISNDAENEFTLNKNKYLKENFWT